MSRYKRDIEIFGQNWQKQYFSKHHYEKKVMSWHQSEESKAGNKKNESINKGIQEKARERNSTESIEAIQHGIERLKQHAT